MNKKESFITQVLHRVCEAHCVTLILLTYIYIYLNEYE